MSHLLAERSPGSSLAGTQGPPAVQTWVVPTTCRFAIMVRSCRKPYGPATRSSTKT